MSVDPDHLFPTQPELILTPSDPAHPHMRDEPPECFLWIDGPDAQAGIERRRRTGAVAPGEAETLRHWAEHGYVVLQGCIPPGLIDAAFDDLDRAWNERRRVGIDLLTTGERTFIDAVPPETRASPLKVNDLYLHSEAARKIFLDPRIVRFGELIFDNRVVGCNSLTFEYGTQQPAHVDHTYMTPMLPRRLFAAWVACEDIDPDSGPLELWPGSHRLAPYDFGPTHYHYTRELDVVHSAYLAEQKHRFPKREFLAKKGDVLLWHAMLIHGGGKVRRERATRRSMAFHYFSLECYGNRCEGMAGEGSALYLTKKL